MEKPDLEKSDGLFSGGLGDLPNGKILPNAKLLNLKKGPFWQNRLPLFFYELPRWRADARFGNFACGGELTQLDRGRKRSPEA